MKAPAVLIVDQDADRRFNVKQLISAAKFEICGEAGYGAAAVTLAFESKPDVILVAMERGGSRARQTVASLVETVPETPVVVYSPDNDLEVARQAMQTGARDFLTIPMNSQDLQVALLATLDAEGRRRMRGNSTEAPAPLGTVVTVFGPKGGIGKTTVVTNLSVALAGRGQSVVTIDADAGFGDVTGMLDIQPTRTILDLSANLAEVTRETLPRFLLSHKSGLSVLASPARGLDWKNIPLRNFKKIIDTLARSYDMVIIDTSGILDELTLVALQQSAFVLWITTTEFSSIKDSQTAIRILKEMGLPLERIHLLINQTSPVNDVRPEAVADTLEQSIFWLIPYDKDLRRSAQMGHPVMEMEPDSKVAKSFVDLAERVSGARGAPTKQIFSRFRRRSKRHGAAGTAEPAMIASTLEGERS